MSFFVPIAWFISGFAGFILALYAYNEDRPKRRVLLAAISAPLLVFFAVGALAIVWYVWVASKNGGDILPTPH
jgi:hypothetical protein